MSCEIVHLDLSSHLLSHFSLLNLHISSAKEHGFITLFQMASLWFGWT